MLIASLWIFKAVIIDTFRNWSSVIVGLPGDVPEIRDSRNFMSYAVQALYLMFSNAVLNF